MWALAMAEGAAVGGGGGNEGHRWRTPSRSGEVTGAPGSGSGGSASVEAAIAEAHATVGVEPLRVGRREAGLDVLAVVGPLLVVCGYTEHPGVRLGACEAVYRRRSPRARPGAASRGGTEDYLLRHRAPIPPLRRLGQAGCVDKARVFRHEQDTPRTRRLRVPPGGPDVTTRRGPKGGPKAPPRLPRCRRQRAMAAGRKVAPVGRARGCRMPPGIAARTVKPRAGGGRGCGAGTARGPGASAGTRYSVGPGTGRGEGAVKHRGRTSPVGLRTHNAGTIKNS